jgi:hypothetical protein
MLTLVRHGPVGLTALVAGQGTGGPASEVECWHELWTPRLADTVIIRSSGRGAMLRLVVAVPSRERLRRHRRSPPNAGHFEQDAARNIKHFG